MIEFVAICFPANNTKRKENNNNINSTNYYNCPFDHLSMVLIIISNASSQLLDEETIENLTRNQCYRFVLIKFYGLTLYPRYVNSIASVNDIKAKINCTAHNSFGRFTHIIASQLIIGRS